MKEELKDVVIVSGGRSPRGRFGGTLKDIPAVDLSIAIVPKVIERAGIKPDQVDMLIWGHSRQAGCGGNPARQIAVRSGIPSHAPNWTINKACLSAMQAVIDGVNAIRLGDAEIVVAGGVESMSNIPYLLPKVRWGLRLGDATLMDGAEGVCRICGLSMGMATEKLAQEYGISREEQDRFALESHQKAAKAQDSGWFDPEIIPVEVPQPKGKPLLFTKDEVIRRDTSLEALSKLSPAFEKDGTITAGNSCPLTDGANALLLMSRAKAERLGIKPLASFISYHTIGVEPVYFGLGPARAVPPALEKANLTLGQIDLIELNEAFAAQVLACYKELRWDWSHFNIHGGAKSLGHPTGSTGSRLIVTLIYALGEHGGRYGLATLCGGGGLGGAVIIKLE